VRLRACENDVDVESNKGEPDVDDVEEEDEEEEEEMVDDAEDGGDGVSEGGGGDGPSGGVTGTDGDDPGAVSTSAIGCDGIITGALASRRGEGTAMSDDVVLFSPMWPKSKLAAGVKRKLSNGESGTRVPQRLATPAAGADNGDVTPRGESGPARFCARRLSMTAVTVRSKCVTGRSLSSNDNGR